MILTKPLSVPSSNPFPQWMGKKIFKNLLIKKETLKNIDINGYPVVSSPWTPQKKHLNPLGSTHGGYLFKFLDELGGLTGFTFVNQLNQKGKLSHVQGFPFVVTTGFNGRMFKAVRVGDNLIGISHITGVMKDKLEILAVLLRRKGDFPAEKVAEAKFQFTPVQRLQDGHLKKFLLDNHPS